MLIFYNIKVGSEVSTAGKIKREAPKWKSLAADREKSKNPLNINFSILVHFTKVVELAETIPTVCSMPHFANFDFSEFF